MALTSIIAKKAAVGFILFIITIAVNFTLIHLAPGDPITYLLAGQTAEGFPRGYIDEIKAKYGLDQPIPIQFLAYTGQVFRGDFGDSFYHGKPVLDLVLERLPNTLILTGVGFAISVTFGLLLGVRCAKKPYSKFDNFFSIFSLIFWSLPFFWVGIMFIITFSIYYKLLPAQGMVDVGAQGFEYLASYLRHLTLPAITLGLGGIAIYLRLARASMLEQLNLDYIKTAWAKGCSFTEVFYGHAFKNALLPLITIIALRMRFLIMGALLVETTFAWPGIGRLLYESIRVRDYGLIQCIFIFYSIITIVLSMAADIAYAAVDPRLRK